MCKQLQQGTVLCAAVYSPQSHFLNTPYHFGPKPHIPQATHTHVRTHTHKHTRTCCLLPFLVSMTNCMVSLMSVSVSPTQEGAGPFFSWLFSCRGIATSSWCTLTASPLRCYSNTTHTYTQTQSTSVQQDSNKFVIIHNCRND